jgi:O-antigen/teichoic acid export membrane protein
VHKGNSVPWNSIWLLLSRLTAQGLAILFIAVVARRLGVEAFGQFTFISSVVLIGNTFTNFGTDTYLIREIARSGHGPSLIAQAFGLQLLFSALWILTTIGLRPSSPLLVYSFALFPLALFSVSTAVLRAFERMDLVWTLSLTNGVLQLVGALLSFDLLILNVLLLVGQFLLAALAYWICSVSLAEFRLLPIKAIWPLLKAVLPFATLTILLVVSQRMGILLVSGLLDDSATGLFSSVTRIVDGLKLGHYAILGALLPVISRGGVSAKRSFRHGFILLLSLTLFMALALSFFPRLIIWMLYGETFAAAGPLLPWLGWSLIPYTISSFISYDLIARGQENSLVKATAVSLAVFLALYVGLILADQLSGAIYAALIGEIIQAVIFFRFLHKSGVDLPFRDQPQFNERIIR